jgi:hypothetical protein
MTVETNEDGWDLYERAGEAYKAKDYQAALDLCRESWRAFGNGAKPEKLRNRYGFCIYYLELKPLAHADELEGEEEDKPQPADRAARALKITETICSMTSQGQYSPYAVSLLALVKILKRNQGRWSDIATWTAKLNPDDLSAEPFPFTDRDGKRRELASQLEQWYAARVRALMETEAFQECIALAEEYSRRFIEGRDENPFAFASPRRLAHYDYDVWIPSWQAKAMMCLQRAPEALSLADSLVSRKRLPATLALQSKSREATGDAVGSWVSALEAVHERVEPKHLLVAVERVMEVLEARNDKGDLWRKMVELLMRIRRTEDWRIPGALQTRAAEAGVIDSNLDRVADLQRVLGDLRPCWFGLWEQSEPRVRGTIETLRDKSAFLKMDGGKSVFCPTRSLPASAREGAPVSFWLRPSFDRKKNRFSEQAVEVRLDG